MDQLALVRRVVSQGHAARNQAGIKVRQPVAQLRVKLADPSDEPALEAHSALILDELNVKSLETVSAEGELATYLVRPRADVLGPKHGGLLPEIEWALQARSEEHGARLRPERGSCFRRGWGTDGEGGSRGGRGHPRPAR